MNFGGNLIILPTFLPTYLPKYIHKHIPTYLPIYIHKQIPTQYLPTYLPAYICTYLPTYIHTYLFTYIHTYLHTYIHTYLPTYIASCSVLQPLKDVFRRRCRTQKNINFSVDAQIASRAPLIFTLLVLQSFNHDCFIYHLRSKPFLSPHSRLTLNSLFVRQIWGASIFAQRCTQAFNVRLEGKQGQDWSGGLVRWTGPVDWSQVCGQI